MDTSNWTSKVSATSMVDDLRNGIHVLLVDHESHVLAPIIDMLEHFFLKVTTVKFASTALAILEERKENFDLLLENIHSPDAYGYKLLLEAAKMDLPVILLFERDDVVLAKMALEVGAILCIKKPITMEIGRYLWQLVLWEKTGRRKRNERYRELNMVSNNMHNNIGVGELTFIKSENANSEESHNNTKIKSENSSSSSTSDMVSLRGKVWTEWTEELHDKFMFAVRQLGEGKCYPKDILDLMNVPGLTRMQVASHLQKCRSGSWIAPTKRKAKTSGAKRLRRGAARKKLGFMPASFTNLNIPQIHYKTPNECYSSSAESEVLDDSKGSDPFPHVKFEIGSVDYGEDDIGLHVTDAQSFAIASPNKIDYFELPNMDSTIYSYCSFEEVSINYNAPVMNNANVEKFEKTSKLRDDDGKTQVVVKKEEE